MFRTPLVRRRVPSQRCEPDRYGELSGWSLTGFHRIAYTDWGPSHANVPVVCVHGLTRQGRDFDYLASHLSRMGRRVVCPDLVGHGRSGRLRSADRYAIPQYCADIHALIARLGAAQVDWIGTSLGGVVGMVLAGLPGTPIRRIVINDIGPSFP
jgi:pimeloyl-ACP methyl ester carboxylesterase